MTNKKIIAFEGVGGAGKTTLVKALAEIFNKAAWITAHRGLGATVIKRPSDARWAAFCEREPNPTVGALDRFMTADLNDALAEAEEASTGYVFIDRHYVTQAVYQHPDDFNLTLGRYIREIGEPTAWVFCDADTDLIQSALSERPRWQSSTAENLADPAPNDARWAITPPSKRRKHIDQPDDMGAVETRRRLFRAARERLQAPVFTWHRHADHFTIYKHFGDVNVGCSGAGDDARRWLVDQILRIGSAS